MPKHEQTWVKVNTHVDAGVLGIVSALSLFPTLQTIESCQGDGEKAAWVCFSFGPYWQSSWKETAAFVLGFLAPKLFEKVGDSIRLSLRPRQCGDVLVDLTVRAGALMDTERALVEIAQDFNSC